MTDTAAPSLPLRRAARLFRLLGSPACVHMLLELDRVGEAHASALARAVGLSERRAREHLRLLRHAGVVEFRPAEGRLYLYRLAPGLTRSLLGLVR
jgi:DNA-binding transcriptional ArsR family regulator